jgi:nicotinamide-nucleotide amidase
MPVAEIITIGTELLLGEIQDTNTRFLARSLCDIGVDLYRTTCVGDNSQRIESVIRESLERSDIVLTTGGLGPTVDDPTRQAVANALGVKLKFHPELWEQIEAIMSRYGRTASENNSGRGGCDSQSSWNRARLHCTPGRKSGHLPARGSP